MSLDIVVPVYDSHDMTWRCVSHLLLYRAKNWNIIVVNDASKDPAPEMFGYFSKLGVRVIHHEENQGCHAAWNTGWRAGRAERVCFINNDIVPAPYALHRMMMAMDLTGLPYMGAMDVSDAAAFSPHALLRIEAGRHQALEPEVGRDFNSFFVVKRDVLDDLGGFDDRMRLVFADMDFVERMKDRHAAPAVLSSAVCYHGRSVSRKRQGVYRDVEQVLKDQAIFREKWKDRPDVLAKHPPYTRDSALRSTTHVWNTEGER